MEHQGRVFLHEFSMTSDDIEREQDFSSHQFSRTFGSVWFHDDLLKEVEVISFPEYGLAKRELATALLTDSAKATGGEVQETVPIGLIKVGLSEMLISFVCDFASELITTDLNKVFFFCLSYGLLDINRERIFRNENYPKACKIKDVDWAPATAILKSAYPGTYTVDAIVTRMKAYSAKMGTKFSEDKLKSWLQAVGFEDDDKCVATCAGLLAVLLRVAVKDDDHMLNLGASQSWKQLTKLLVLLKEPPDVTISKTFVQAMATPVAWMQASITIATMKQYIDKPQFSSIAMTAYMQRYLFYSLNPYTNLTAICNGMGLYPKQVLKFFWSGSLIDQIRVLMVAVRLYGEHPSNDRYAGQEIPEGATVRFFPVCRLINLNFCACLSTKHCSQIACCLYGFLTKKTDSAAYAIPSLDETQVEFYLKIGAEARDIHDREEQPQSSKSAAKVWKSVMSKKSLPVPRPVVQPQAVTPGRPKDSSVEQLPPEHFFEPLKLDD